MLAKEEFNPRLLVWGPRTRVVPLLQRLKNIPITWGYNQEQNVPLTFTGETNWGDELSALDGSNGHFLGRLSSGQKIAAGTVVLFPDTPEIKPPSLIPGQVLVILLIGVQRGVFARALMAALDLADSHQIYIITDDIQVAYPGGEEQYKAARAAGILFFRTADYCLHDNTARGFEIELPWLNVSIQADYVLNCCSLADASSWRSSFNLGSLSVSGILNTRREGVYIFPGADQTAPQEEPWLYDALAARIRANSQGKANFCPEITVNQTDCALCLTCYRICPHQAISLVADKQINNLYQMAASINPAACRWCGTCAAVCPAGAIKWESHSAASGCVLACENSGWDNGIENRAPVKLFPCAGAISNTDILQALVDYNRVTIYSCREGGCRHPGCAPDLEERIKPIIEFYKQMGLAADINLIRKSAAEFG